MILITGGAGFIGSYLAARLDARKERVVVCDWLGNEDKWRNIAKRDLENIVEPEKLPEFLALYGKELKAIVHLGAISTTTERNADAIAENNFRLSRFLWLWCEKERVRLIYASSAATYGDGTEGFEDTETIEGLAALRPLNAYGWSKHLFDRWIAQRKKLGCAGPPQCAGLKFFNVYGPNEYHKGPQRSVAHQIFPYAVRGEAFALFKSHRSDIEDGGQKRDFVWVGDCANVVLWLLDTPGVNGLFNLGSGQARTFLDLTRGVYAAACAPARISFCDMPEVLRGKYQYFTQANMAKLRAAGYHEPFTPLEEGLRLYVQEYLMKEDPYA